MGGSVYLECSEQVARVTLSHPGKFNAMSRAMWHELKAVFKALQARNDLSAVLISGEAHHFCAGGDISEYAQFRFAEASLRHFHEDEVWGGLSAMLDCDLPIVALIEGNCMGAGIEIASCCDVRLASNSARFGAPIGRLGFPMAPREAAVVLRAAGELTAREMLLTAAVIDAPRMQQRGFLNDVFGPAELDDAAEKVLARMAGLAPQAARLNKQCFRALAQTASAPTAPDLIAGAYRYANSAEHREGIASFIEKRPPRFSVPS